MLALFIFTYLSIAAYGLFIYRAYDASLEVSLQKSLLFGFSQVEGTDSEGDYVIFQAALGFIVFTMTYEQPV
jgi:hypothetical protein